MSTLDKNIDTETNTSKPNYNPFYKVNYLVNGMIDAIFVFYGKKIVPEDHMTIIQKILQNQRKKAPIYL